MPDGSSRDPGCDWLEPFERWTPGKQRQSRDRQPLILSGHGVRLRVRHGALEIQDGFTHYPQRRKEWRLFPGDWRLPSCIVMVDGNGSLTFDVLAWLATQSIPLIQVNWRGEAVVVVGGSGYVADPKRVAVQLAAQGSESRRMVVNRWLVADKIARSAETLTRVLEPSAARERALHEIATSTEEMTARPPMTIDALRGIEGRVAQAYFRAWRTMPLRWKGIGRNPIPEDWHCVGSRVSPKSETNRQATHPVNAMLNYGYAVLETQVQMAVVGAGFDPTIGYMHAQHPGRAAFILDLMEPLRPAVDETVLLFVAESTFAPADFTIASNGVCRLHPQLAKRLVGEVGQIGGLAPIISELPKRLGQAARGR